MLPFESVPLLIAGRFRLRYELGVLADDGRDLLFEYSTQAIKRALELSPFKLPLSTKSYSDFPEHQLRLPGMISDELPP